VLTSAHALLVVENFESSDEHGHDCYRYLEYGQADGRTCVVVLLCHRHQPNRQRDGWENAVVLTYSELLSDLQHTSLPTRDGVVRTKSPCSSSIS
jgi:hypothetical protein